MVICAASKSFCLVSLEIASAEFGLIYSVVVTVFDFTEPEIPAPSAVSKSNFSDPEERLAYIRDQAQRRLVNRMRALGVMDTAPETKEELKAEFVDDDNVEDGQVFPAGAEFVKSWRMQNVGDIAWPESTEIIFVAGDRMPAFTGAPLRYYVGGVEPGEFAYACAMDLKVGF